MIEEVGQNKQINTLIPLPWKPFAVVIEWEVKRLLESKAQNQNCSEVQTFAVRI